MGFNFDVIKKPFEGAVKGFITSGGNPAGAFSGIVQGAEQGKLERKLERQKDLQAEYEKQRKAYEMEVYSRDVATGLGGTSLKNTSGVGFGSTFGTFLSDFGRNIVSPLTGIGRELLPFFGRSEQQQPAIDTTRRGGAQESQGSGSKEANIGIGLPGLINLGRQFLRKPTGQIITGTGLGGAVSMLTGQEQPSMRITRKMKSQARMVLNMTGGNLSAASQILGVDENTLVMILLKRFRNDGPVVTKAALRKTKQTVRRLKSMCDMYDDLRPRAAARRRASPVRRSTTTLIKN